MRCVCTGGGNDDGGGGGGGGINSSVTCRMRAAQLESSMCAADLKRADSRATAATTLDPPTVETDHLRDTTHTHTHTDVKTTNQQHTAVAKAQHERIDWSPLLITIGTHRVDWPLVQRKLFMMLFFFPSTPEALITLSVASRRLVPFN